MTYLNDGIEGELSYTYAPEFEANFPKCENFSILRDYNQDGLMDIFTYNNVPQSLKLYTGFINNFPIEILCLSKKVSKKVGE